MSEIRENVIEWITGDDHVAVTLTDRRYISKVRKLREIDEKNVPVFVENKDGSIFAHLPLSTVKLSQKTKQNLSDEQRDVLRERMRSLHAAKEAKKA